MSCECQNCVSYDTRCSPCNNCGETPEPIAYKCDGVDLPDGVYTNPTITVEEGCISAIESGRPIQYTPDVCCSGAGSSGGGGGSGEICDCEKGDPGENAEIFIGTVYGVASDEDPRVVNVGTPTVAILDFYIPRGEKGESGQSQTGADSELGGILIENGTIITLPGTWPPVLAINTETSATVQGVDFRASPPDPETGLVNLTLDLTNYDAILRADIARNLEAVQTALQNQIDALTTRMSAAESRITTIQNNCCGP